MSGVSAQQPCQRVDWDLRWSVEARKKQLPSLHGIVSKFSGMPDVIGMHGGLPPSDSFPFSFFTGGLAGTGDAAAGIDDDVLEVTEPRLVAAAQQYNMHSQGYGPLVSWAHQMVTSLHQPATLNPTNSTSLGPDQNPSSALQQQQQQPQTPIGMDVVITQGSSAGLEALFRMLLNPGDPILLEEYTYAHVVEADLLPMGCEMLSIQLDEGGLIPCHLDAIMTQRAAAGLSLPRVLYTIPTGQNPTGSIMSRERMLEIYALARKWDLVVLEDDAYYWLQYPDGPDSVPGLSLRPGFLSLDVDGRVVRLDTLAKLLGPGFRLGWLSGPPELAAKFALYTAGTSIGANMLSQVMIHELLVKWGSSGFEAFVKRLQRRYAQQAAVAAAAAEQHLAGLAEWQLAKAGMFLWLKMTGPGADSSALVEASAAEGVMIIPGHLISVPHLQAAARHRHQQDSLALAAKLQRQLQQQQGVALEGCNSQPQQTQQKQQQDDSSSAGTGMSMSIKTTSNSSSSKDLMSSCPGSVPAVATSSSASSEAPLPPSPHFRLSFVSVGPEAIREGFLRLQRAIVACRAAGQERPPSPSTPPLVSKGEPNTPNSVFPEVQAA